MRVSVIMPVLNGARFLSDALASVAGQTFAPFEVIIVDGPSMDETPQIARAYTRARYVRQSGSGMWNALNEGLALARGDAIAFLSSDDLWHPDKLRLQNDWLRDHPETSCVFSYARYLALEPGSPLADAKPELFAQPFPAYLTENLLARQSLFDRLGAFPTEYRISSDIDWLGRLLDSGENIHILPQTLLTKRFHTGNLSTVPSSASDYNRELLQIMRNRILRNRGAVYIE